MRKVVSEYQGPKPSTPLKIILSSPMELIPGIQAWFAIGKASNIVFKITYLKRKTYTLHGCLETFGKLQQ